MHEDLRTELHLRYESKFLRLLVRLPQVSRLQYNFLRPRRTTELD